MADDEERLQEIQEVFDKYDIEKEGNIQTFELVNVFGSLKSNATQDDVEAILKELNITGSTICMEEFRDIVKANDEREQKVELIEAFRYFDKGNKGYITYDQLAKIIKPMLDTEMTKEELQEIITKADADNSGTIEIEEFVDFLSQ